MGKYDWTGNTLSVNEGFEINAAEKDFQGLYAYSYDFSLPVGKNTAKPIVSWGERMANFKAVRNQVLEIWRDKDGKNKVYCVCRSTEPLIEVKPQKKKANKISVVRRAGLHSDYCRLTISSSKDDALGYGVFFPDKENSVDLDIPSGNEYYFKPLEEFAILLAALEKGGALNA